MIDGVTGAYAPQGAVSIDEPFDAFGPPATSPRSKRSPRSVTATLYPVPAVSIVLTAYCLRTKQRRRLAQVTSSQSFGRKRKEAADRTDRSGKHGDEWHIEITFSKVQPRSSVWTEDELLIGTVDAREVVLAGQIFGDNFDPVPIELTIVSEPTKRGMTVKDLRSCHDSRDDED